MNGSRFIFYIYVCKNTHFKKCYLLRQRFRECVFCICTLTAWPGGCGDFRGRNNRTPPSAIRSSVTQHTRAIFITISSINRSERTIMYLRKPHTHECRCWIGLNRTVMCCPVILTCPSPSVEVLLSVHVWPQYDCFPFYFSSSFPLVFPVKSKWW